MRLGRYQFDPLMGVAEVPDELRTRLKPDERGPWIVQFHRPLTIDEQRRLRRAYRLALTEYIPEGAYLEILAPEVRAALTADDLVRAIVPYEPAFKVAPQIGERLF
ncbi:MAG TPA: hypothetical protein PLH75_03925, partial [Amaricoccus sp.]|nr:hypothetical protein [Amaricoccus sp.]